MKKKVLAYLLILLMFTEGVLFQYYIARNELHHCSENHCPICLVLHEADTVLNQLLGGILLVVAFFAVYSLLRQNAIVEILLETRTLIKWKVRMDH